MENFNKIYGDYYDKTILQIRSKIRNLETAEDLATEVFIKVNKHLNNFDGDKSSMRTWVFNITKHTVIDHLRRKNLKAISMTDLSDDQGNELVFHTNNSTPETNMINSQLGETITNAIDSLSDKNKLVIDLFLVQQKTLEEINKLTDLPIGTIKATIHRGKNALREKLSNL